MKENAVYVGNKKIMDYVTAILSSSRKNNEVEIHARGRKISLAVDIVNMTIRDFLSTWEIKNVSIGSENLDKQVSSIKITVGVSA